MCISARAEMFGCKWDDRVQGRRGQAGKRRLLEGMEEGHLAVPEVKAQGEIEA